MEHTLLYMALATVFGLFMAWGIGANDVANAMGTSVGSRAITIRQALLIAAIFEFGGAVLAGSNVTDTIRNGIVMPHLFDQQPRLLIYGMLSALLASGIWLLVASRRGWPVSTTHSIVGAIVGFAVVSKGTDAVQWANVTYIVTSWVISPIVAGIISYLIFRSAQKLILEHDQPLLQARRYVPFYMFLAGFMITLVTLLSGLKYLHLTLSHLQSYAVATAIGILIALIGKFFISRIKVDAAANRDFHFATVERVFGILMVSTACCMAFAHGSNDVANAVGPVAAIVAVAQTGVVSHNIGISIWILVLGGVGIVVGLATYGRHVIATVGREITDLTPSRGFAAELAAASTIVVASSTGMPISTTHTLVGAILGVGFARGIAAINLQVVRTIILSWVVTVPVGALLSIVIFTVIRVLLPN
ncbi:MAG TPA: anion permease [Gammaproteobacteria bacterium]|nr:anion permease [Gammaproteobacteria bacterium]